MARKSTKKIIENEKEHVYHSGENLRQITKELTGKTYLMFRLLEVNGLSLNTIKDGDILKWRV